MTLSGDNIIEASLLRPRKEEHGTSPTLEEEAILLGDNPETTSLPEHPEIYEQPEPSEQIDTKPTRSTEQTDTLSTPPTLSPVTQLSCHPSQKAKKPQREIGADPNQAGEWVGSYLQKNERVPEWRREFWSLLCSKD